MSAQTMPGRSGHGRGRASVSDQINQAMAQVKPRMRGWLHTAMTPLMFLAGLTLMILTPTVGGRLAVAVYTCTSLALFGNSAVYHRGHWSDHTSKLLRRIDHSNIFLFIAGTYTPLAVQLLDGSARVLLLCVVWACAALGVAFRVLWLGAPRWLYTVLYIAMGWVAVGWLPQFWHNGGPMVVLLIAAGGLVYTAGAVVYARKRPNPSPTWFGFHEIFHACTIAAAICHLAAICLATF